ncbi:hypothetical protein D3C72_1625960 [compost metagenome]
MLDRQILEDGLDDKVALGQPRQLRRSFPALHRGSGGACRQLAALLRSRQERFRLAPGTIQRFLSHVEHNGPESRAGRNDRNARPHGAGARDADGLNGCHIRLLFPQEAAANQLAVHLIDL